jgi:hypothetical protein
MIILKGSKGEPINSVDQWLQIAPPAKGEKHWQDGRSAKELAKAWFRNGIADIPEELNLILDSHNTICNFQMDFGIPEHETKLDGFKGGYRNHDLIISGTSAGGRTIIGVEAKVDEPFGDIASLYAAKSMQAKASSKVSERVQQLSKALFDTLDTSELRYQLIHSIAGTLIEASRQKAVQAVFIVHEFLPSGGQYSRKAKQNEVDLQRFVQLLTGKLLTVGQLIGPIIVPGGGLVPKDIPLFIGKIQSE